MHSLFIKDMSFYKKVAKIAVPIALQGLITTGVNMMDTVMVGKLGEAFASDKQVVLLIDEIDKADLEFPNDLLWELDKMEFYIPETGKTLRANSLQKAQYLYDRIGCDCFADDTGLEVDALGGAPGVYTARYAGEGKDFNANMDKVLYEH